MRIPVATYRVQFNRDFRFADATAVVRHLARLGISHLYASPIFEAREGSTHGYDVIDPSRLNPALGSAEDFDALVSELRSHGMGLLVDLVPNHMAASTQNRWWMDVLENGPASEYASWFGIDWSERILVPVLGSAYGAALENQELQLVYADGEFRVTYYTYQFPIDPASYGLILHDGAPEVLSDWLQAIERLPAWSASDWVALETRRDEKEQRKQELAAILPRDFLEQRLRELNGVKGDPRSFDALDRLLCAQPYRLAYWRTAPERINYRRFFDVAELISMRVEQEEMFEAAHALIFDLLRTGKVEGLRIDHIDGLLDPQGYLKRIASAGCYTVVEKILSDGEQLPADWPVQGTTGYDFAGMLNGLYVRPDGLSVLDEIYREATGFEGTLADVEYERKKHVMRELFRGDLQRLGRKLQKLAEEDRYWRDLSPQQIQDALVEVTACMPVYRTYTRGFAVSPEDLRYLTQAVGEARRRNPDLHPVVYDMLFNVLTLQQQNENWLRFVMLWQQMTGPIMAKGVEDSAFYNYNRLVSMNEVGAVPRPVSPGELHTFFEERQPHTMNASSTHDTKRSEDVRARINVLSELPDGWRKVAERLLRKKPNGIHANTAFLLYQVVLGAWPLDDAQAGGFRERLKNYMQKAAREARMYTSWLEPRKDYEDALLAYVDELLNDDALMHTAAPLRDKLAFYGAVNSLSQLLIKATAPGVPDFYRGTVEWDLSLVDPDNRRPVEFCELTDFAERAPELLAHWRDGRAKIFLTEKLLAFRKSREALFRDGNYVRLATEGKRAEHAFCYARRHGSAWVITVAPRWTAALSSTARVPTGFPAWRDTAAILPDDAPRTWRNVLTGSRFTVIDGQLRLSKALSEFPVGLLAG